MVLRLKRQRSLLCTWDQAALLHAFLGMYVRPSVLSSFKASSGRPLAVSCSPGSLLSGADPLLAFCRVPSYFGCRRRHTHACHEHQHTLQCHRPGPLLSAATQPLFVVRDQLVRRTERVGVAVRCQHRVRPRVRGAAQRGEALVVEAAEGNVEVPDELCG